MAYKGRIGPSKTHKAQKVILMKIEVPEVCSVCKKNGNQIDKVGYGIIISCSHCGYVKAVVYR